MQRHEHRKDGRMTAWLEHLSWSPRWVLAIRGGKVCYSRGGAKHFFCNTKTFREWIARVSASRQTKRMPRRDDHASKDRTQSTIDTPPG
jgi:hypothetical protein